MRKLFLLVCISLSLCATAQYNTEAKPNIKSTAGYQLRQASNYYFAGMGCYALGGLSYVGITSTQTSSSAQSIVIVGAFGLAGTILNIFAWIHIHNAGKLMDAQKVSFINNKYGSGIAFNF